LSINMLRALPLAFLILVCSACGGSARDGSSEIEYSVSAKQNYDRGMAALSDDEWVDAAKFFAFVKARFPYSKFAVLADLRIADAAFGAGSYLEAIDGYKQFIKFHPTHDMVESGYAAFKIGESYYRMIPDDFFLLPPSFEKDQSATHDALRELRNFLRDYPQSEHAVKADKMRKEAARSLAAHEWYVAEYYWKRDLPMGTVLRLRTLLAKYAGVGYDEGALLRLGDAYLRVGRKEDARRAWATLVARYPRASQAREAHDRLRRHFGASK
jgi:outer membrane protein assembly factor BamD